MKKWGHMFSFTCFLTEFSSLNLKKKCMFMQFRADLSKKSKSIKAIYIHISHYELSENSIVYYAMT